MTIILPSQTFLLLFLFSSPARILSFTAFLHNPCLTERCNIRSSAIFDSNGPRSERTASTPSSNGPRPERTASTPSSSGPRSERTASTPSSRRRSQPRREPRRRQPRQSPEERKPFNAASLVADQTSNQDAGLLDITSSTDDRVEIPHPHCTFHSLDELFDDPHLQISQKFSSSQEFRESIRRAMREDIFFSSPLGGSPNLSQKATEMLLAPDSSVQGSWIDPGPMRRLTEALRLHLGDRAPSGESFSSAIGELCGEGPTGHWIDIVGRKDRVLNHSWHQDTGSSASRSKTVLLGFPAEDGYVGTGVFSHVVKLRYENRAGEDHPRGEPVLFMADIEEEFVIRPVFEEGKEIVVYNDVDVLHSAPDVTYRSSVMRFM